MRGTLRLIAGPAVGAVAIDLARQHLRQDQTEDDAIIALQLQAAMQAVEAETGRALVPQTWEYEVEEAETCITLPIAPVLEIEAVTVEGLGSLYSADLPSGPTCGRAVVRLEGVSGRTVIRFRAGYQNVPAPLQAAVLLALGSLYDNRSAEAETGGTARSLSANPAYMRLIRPYQLIG